MLIHLLPHNGVKLYNFVNSGTKIQISQKEEVSFKMERIKIFHKEYFKEIIIRWSNYLKWSIIFPFEEYTRKPSVVTNVNLTKTKSFFTERTFEYFLNNVNHA